MEGPDERQMIADLNGAPYILGESRGRWGRPEKPVLNWPTMIFWVSAAPREKGPDRFFLGLNCEGYPVRSPTGGFCDPDKGDILAADKWPKGTNRVADVFQFGWRNGAALYHPQDRVTWDAHPQAEWRQKYASLAWTRDHTIADYLQMVHELLNSSEYIGV